MSKIRIRYSENLVLAQGISPEDAQEIIQFLADGIVSYNIYFVCIKKGTPATMEIYPLTEILKSVYKGLQITVIGIAETKQKAFELAGQICYSAYKKHGPLESLQNVFKIF